MISNIESRSVDKKKITFLTSSINADTLDILRSDQSSKLFRFSEDGEHIEFAFKQIDDQIAYIPLEKSDKSLLTTEVQGALSNLKQDMIKEIVVAYSNTNYDFEHNFGEYTDDNENYSENIPSRLTEDGYVHEEDYVRHPPSEYLPDDTDLYSDEYESVDHEIAENYSENIPSKMTEDGYVFGDDANDEDSFIDVPGEYRGRYGKGDNSIFDSNLEDADFICSYNKTIDAYDIKIYNDYKLEPEDEYDLREAGILVSDDDDRDALIFQTDIRAYTNDLLLHGYDDTKIINPEICAYLDECIHAMETNKVLRQSIVNSAVNSAEFEQHMNVQPEVHTPVVHSPYKSDAELLAEFDVISSEDSYAEIKIRNADLVTEGISEPILDELDNRDFLYTDSNNAAILRVEIDVDGSVLEPEFNDNFDKLSNDAKDTINSIHNEFSQELEIVVSDHEKREREADVLSHHHFLSDQKIHKTGYMLLEVKGDVWKEFSEDKLREQGLSVSDGRYAAKFAPDVNGDLKFEHQGTSSIARAFESDQLKMNANLIDPAVELKQRQDAERFERAAEKFAEKNDFTLVRDENKFALIPNSQVVMDREDGLKSVLATKMDTQNIVRFEKLDDIKHAMKEAVAIDRAEHKFFEKQKLDMHVVTPTTMKNAVQKFDKNSDASVNVRTVSGDYISLQRNEDFSITASSRDGSNSGQRVVVDGSREHTDAKINSMIKDNIYIEKCTDCYKIGSLDETKPRYAEKTLGMALRAAVVTKEDIDVEKAKEVDRQNQTETTSDLKKSVQIAIG